MNITDNRLIKCDTIKIMANLRYLIEKHVPFNTEYATDGTLTGEYYSSRNDDNIPFNVYVAASYTKQTLTLEFSSKILYANYAELISKKTIRQCLENLNGLGVCKIDIDGILNTGCVTKADITRDIPMELTNEILSALNDNVGMYRRYKWKHYRNAGIEFSRNVKDRRSKESLKIYDKSVELTSNSESRKFLSMLDDMESIEDYFSGITRFEITLNTNDKIREFLNIQDTYIADFFNADANPILTMFDKIFTIKPTGIDGVGSSYNDWAMLIILDHFHGDLQQIEQRVRNLYSDRKGAYSRMKQFERLKVNTNNRPRDIVSEVRRRLM